MGWHSKILKVLSSYQMAVVVPWRVLASQEVQIIGSFKWNVSTGIGCVAMTSTPRAISNNFGRPLTF